MKPLFFKTTLVVFLSSLIVFKGGNNLLNAQVIPGSKDITVQRCNWILDNVPDHFKAIVISALSDDFAGLLKEYTNLFDFELDRLLGGIGNDEFMAYWYDGNGEGFTPKAKKTYSFVEGTDNKAKIFLRMEEDYHDVETGEYLYRIHRQFYMMLVKEKGLWKLDDWISDWQSEYGDEWGSHLVSQKEELRDYVNEEKNTTYVRYKGHLLDQNEPRPFVVVLQIMKEDASGERAVRGAFRFNDKKDEFYDGLEGSLTKDGNIHFIVEDYYENNHGFWGKMTPDYNKITGNWQAYHKDGRIAIDRDFIMEIWPRQSKLSDAIRRLKPAESSRVKKEDL